ncbi:MAG: hypothetical protein ACOC3J_05110, partial [Gemmatimonadota bacterium]
MSTVAPAPSASATLDVVRALFAPLDVRDFAVRLWDGTVWRPPAAGAPRLTLVLTRPETLRRLLRAGSEAALAEAYLNGDVRIEGDIYAVPELARALLGRKWTVPERTRIAVRLRSLSREHGGAGGALFNGFKGQRVRFAPGDSELLQHLIRDAGRLDHEKLEPHAGQFGRPISGVTAGLGLGQVKPVHSFRH